MAELSIEQLDAARRDPVVFADVILDAPLWDHQVEVARSEALYRVLCAGRRSGKTRTFGVLALHRAFSVPGSKVLIVSAGEDAAANAFEDMTDLVRASEFLKTSVADDFARSMTLSNGSRIRCVPSSMRQVRSQEADLLIVDEAGFVAQEIWRAVQPITLARPGSRIILSSSPWGGPGHFFHDYWKRGMGSPDAQVRSWHWPATVSPLVSAEQLEVAQRMESSWSFAREYLAEWSDAEGAYFTEAELSGAVADYPLLDPSIALEAGGAWRDGPGFLSVLDAVAGVDWGFNRDANALVLVSALEDHGLNAERFGEGERPFFVPWLEAHHAMDYGDFIGRVLEVAGGYRVNVVASERNGVGQYPTSELQRRVYESPLYGRTWVSPVWTDARRKMSGFGKIKGLLQRGRLVLPNHPELLKQLRALEFQNTESGLTKIAVPERSGHDDLAMALMQAVSCLSSFVTPRTEAAPGSVPESVSTPRGVRVPARPLPCRDAGTWWTVPEGLEKSDGW